MAGMIFGNTPFGTMQDVQDKNDAEAYRYAQLDPRQRMAYDARSMSTGAGQGFTQALGAVAGVDTRPEGVKNTEAMNRVKAALKAQGVDPTDTDAFYGALVRELGKEGLLAEAAAAKSEWTNEKVKLQNANAATQRANAQTAHYERQDANALAKIQNTYGPGAVGIIQAIDAQRAKLNDVLPTSPEAEQIQRNIDMLEQRLARESQGKLTVVNNGGKSTVIDSTGKTIVEFSKSAPPMSDYQKGLLDEKRLTREQKAAALDEKSRLSLARSSEQATRVAEFAAKAMGLVSGKTAGPVGAVASKVPGSDAYQLARTLESVAGNVGFAELQAMRASSPTGGALGQVSDFENRLLQAVQGSLDIGQQPDELKATLEKIMERANALQKAIEEAGGPKAGEVVLPKVKSANTAAVANTAKVEAPADPMAGRTILWKGGKRFAVKNEDVERALTSEGYSKDKQ